MYGIDSSGRWLGGHGAGPLLRHSVFMSRRQRDICIGSSALGPARLNIMRENRCYWTPQRIIYKTNLLDHSMRASLFILSKYWAYSHWPTMITCATVCQSSLFYSTHKPDHFHTQLDQNQNQTNVQPNFNYSGKRINPLDQLIAMLVSCSSSNTRLYRATSSSQ